MANISQVKAISRHARMQAQTPALKETAKVLLVEDNPIDQRILNKCLTDGTDTPPNVKTAQTLQEAFRHLNEEHFHILFLDMNLPDSDGLKTVVDIIDKAPTVPVVVITGETDAAIGEEAIRLGAQDFLVKAQITASGVRAAMRYAIERHKLYHQLEQLIEDNADALLVLTRSGLIRYANSAAAHLFDMPAEKLVGQSLEMDVNNDRTTELEIASDTEGKRTVELHTSPTIWEGSPAYLVTLHDITHQKEKEKRLITEWEMAEAINKAKTRFMTNMSHELRTPLNSVIGFADFILSEPRGPIGDSSYREYIQNISDCGNILLTQINDLLDLAKVDAEELSLHLAEVDLPYLIQRTANMLILQAEAAQITLTQDIQTESLTIVGDEHRIGQIIRNLLSNALNYTPAKGKVTITLRETDSDAIISVRDTGCGIRKADLKRVFDPFVQCHDANDNAHPASTGLGLPLVKHLVALHGGTVQLDSEFGKGTRVTVKLPKTLMHTNQTATI